jgi:hypothetical protein
VETCGTLGVDTCGTLGVETCGTDGTGTDADGVDGRCAPLCSCGTDAAFKLSDPSPSAPLTGSATPATTAAATAAPATLDLLACK